MKKLIQSTDYAGHICTLVDEATGEAIYVGDKYHNGTETIKGGRAPHKPSSTGRVWLEEFSSEYFPGVIGAKWVRADADQVAVITALLAI
jgi:hypothetical protein